MIANYDRLVAAGGLSYGMDFTGYNAGAKVIGLRGPGVAIFVFHTGLLGINMFPPHKRPSQGH
jgi:hypothetical protein